MVTIQKIVTFIMMLMITLHTLCCVWIWLGRENEGQGWIATKSYLISDTHNNDDLYVASMYWVMTTLTTIGFGDITGHSNSEMLFTIVTMFIGIGFFGYIIAHINSMLVQVYTLEELQAKREEQVIMWQMRLARLNKEKMMSSEYYDHMDHFFVLYWNLDYNKLKEQLFFKQLKPRFQNELADILFKLVYDKFDGFFYELEKGF